MYAISITGEALQRSGKMSKKLMLILTHALSTDDLSVDMFGSDIRDAVEGLILPSRPKLSLQHDTVPSSFEMAQGGQEASEFSRPARSIISDEVLEALRTSSRKGRDVVVGLSNACCKWGCSKSEISSLCWDQLLYIVVCVCDCVRVFLSILGIWWPIFSISPKLTLSQTLFTCIGELRHVTECLMYVSISVVFYYFYLIKLSLVESL